MKKDLLFLFIKRINFRYLFSQSNLTDIALGKMEKGQELGTRNIIVLQQRSDRLLYNEVHFSITKLYCSG